MRRPLAIDLFCGLGGWTEGFLAEGYRVIGYDIERRPYPARLVIKNVLKIHGQIFSKAKVIVASPPCQQYSYRAMPWSRAKALPPPDNGLFEACFRIQREASEAAGHYIPLIVENVKGAQKWVGQARWHFGSFYLWGDVPALMPIASTFKISGQNWSRYKETGEVSPHWRLEGLKVGKGEHLRDGAAHTPHLTNPLEHEGIKQRGSGRIWFDKGISQHSSKGNKRKQASAEIAKIPFPLARHIAQCFR